MRALGRRVAAGLTPSGLKLAGVAAKLADLDEQLPRVSDPSERNAIQGASREMRREHTLLGAREQQARNREQELSQSLQSEESRWSALISRLEALTQR